MSNVVRFPVEKRPTPNDSAHEVYADIARAHKERVEMAVDESIAAMYSIIDAFNIPIDNENEATLKGTALVVESIRSLLLSCSNMPHPLQTISMNVFSIAQHANGQSHVVINTEAGNDNPSVQEETPAV